VEGAEALERSARAFQGDVRADDLADIQSDLDLFNS
jgi:hypothetical protein